MELRVGAQLDVHACDASQVSRDSGLAHQEPTQLVGLPVEGLKIILGFLQELVEQHVPIESRMFGLREPCSRHDVAEALVLVRRETGRSFRSGRSSRSPAGQHGVPVFVSKESSIESTPLLILSVNAPACRNLISVMPCGSERTQLTRGFVVQYRLK